MKFLFIEFSLPHLLRDASYPVGGWTVQLSSWLDGISKSGHQAGVLTGTRKYEYIGNVKTCELIETYDPSKGIKIAKYFYSYIPSLLLATRRYQPDVIIQACRGVDTAIMSFVADILRIPFVHRITSDADVDERYSIGLKVYEKIAYRYGLWRASGILCQNEYQLDILRRRFPSKQICIIHNPFKMPDGLSPILPRSSRRYVAWLGSFRYPKNLPLLYQIATDLPEITFRVAGKASPNTDSVTTRAIDELQKLKNVEFVGYITRKDLQPFLSQAAFLLCTSHYEGFSNTFLESLAFGTPVLTRIAADPDGIISKNGLGYVAADQNDLLIGARKLWSLSDADYERLGHLCRTYVANCHSPQKKVEELVAALAPLINRKVAI